MWGDLRGLSLQLLESIPIFPLLKGFRVGEAGILQVLCVHDSLFSRDVTKTEVGKISQPQ